MKLKPFGGSQPLTVGTGGITNNDAQTMTFNNLVMHGALDIGGPAIGGMTAPFAPAPDEQAANGFSAPGEIGFAAPESGGAPSLASARHCPRARQRGAPRQRARTARPAEAAHENAGRICLLRPSPAFAPSSEVTCP